MPANTDIFGFTYPCPGEAVGPASFALLAGQIDTKASELNTDWFEMLNRRNSGDLFSAAVTVVTNSVETQLTTPTYTFPVAGVYLVSAEVYSMSAPATINMFRARFGVTMNTENFVTSGGRPVVPMVAAAGDVASITVFYNGSGTMNVQGRLAAKLICRIA
jgi:hypothetical protein